MEGELVGTYQTPHTVVFEMPHTAVFFTEARYAYVMVVVLQHILNNEMVGFFFGC